MSATLVVELYNRDKGKWEEIARRIVQVTVAGRGYTLPSGAAFDAGGNPRGVPHPCYIREKLVV